MGRKYDGGSTWISWCAIYRGRVRPLNALREREAHGPEYAKTKGSSEDTHLPPPPSLINGMRYYGGWCSNGRVNGPRHLTPCNELGPAEGRGPFRPFSTRSCSQLR